MAANWKMNKNTTQAVKFVQELTNIVEDIEDVDIIICPPFTCLRSLSTMIEIDNLGYHLGAQNMHWEKSGAYTGEVASDMLTDLLVDHVIVGHSERREYFFETDEIVNKKVKSALDSGLSPIFCCGESLQQRESGQTNGHIINQVTKGLEGLTAGDMAKVVVAYEPIWAIGTGMSATADDANEVCALIRQQLKDMFGGECAESTRILYGGSVKPDNVVELMGQSDIDGGLVGGASLEAESYGALITSTAKLYAKAL